MHDRDLIGQGQMGKPLDQEPVSVSRPYPLTGRALGSREVVSTQPTMPTMPNRQRSPLSAGDLASGATSRQTQQIARTLA